MLKGKIFLLFLIALMLVSTSKAMPVINEAMPNPASDWNSNGINETYSDEWIEIYSDSGMSLNNWILGDKVKNYTFHNTTICTDCFLVLYGNQMPIQLNNNNEEVFLYNENGTLVDKFSYASSSKDISICRCSGSLKACNTPTPNSPNACPANQTPPQNPGTIAFSYPSLAFNNGTIFKANVTFANFPPAMYDIKIEIKNQAANIAKILDNNEWVLSDYYLENKVNTSATNDYQFSMKIDSDFTGNATVQLKIKNSTSLLESNVDNMTIAQGAVETQSPSPQQTISYTGDDSSLLIADAPLRASFGETINVDINAYRGNTAKYAIYLYIRKGEDMLSEKVSLHLDDKFKGYSFAVPLKINPNCNADYDEGTYDLVLEGMDKLVLKEITLKGNAECESEELTRKGTVNYKIDFPDEVQAGSEFIVSVKIYNNQNKRQQFSVWSYVQDKDNKCYSCENRTKEGNAGQAIIESDESTTLFLKNTIKNSADGEYKLKVKVLREGYETAKDFTFDIFVKAAPLAVQIISQENNTNAESILNKEQFLNESQGKITGKVIYKAGEKSSITTWLLFLLLSVLLLLYFVARRKSRYSKGADDFDETEKETDDSDDNEEAEEREEEDKSEYNAETSEESGKGDEPERSYAREIGEEGPGENLKEESNELYKEDKEDEN